MEEEEKAVGDMKNSMFGWIDASVLDNQAVLFYLFFFPFFPFF